MYKDTCRVFDTTNNTSNRMELLAQLEESRNAEDEIAKQVISYMQCKYTDNISVSELSQLVSTDCEEIVTKLAEKGEDGELLLLIINMLQTSAKTREIESELYKSILNVV